MHSLATVSAGRLSTLLIALALGVTACTGTPGASTGGNGGGASDGAQSSSGEATVEGSLVSSGLYDATWTWEPGNAAGPGIGGITVTSDKGTFGSIAVLNDGSITFTSGAPELSVNAVYEGTGAQVVLQDLVPCGFTLDNDLTGSTDGGVVHLSGTMTIHGGAFDC